MLRIVGSLVARRQILFTPAVVRPFSRFSRDSKGLAKAKSPPPPKLRLEDAWVEVRDDQTGKIYWWNQVSNETTALDAPKPTGPVANIPQGQVAMPQPQSFAGMVAEGFSWGVGMSLARHAVGSVMGMFGGSSDDIGV